MGKRQVMIGGLDKNVKDKDMGSRRRVVKKRRGV